jgi:hypothetical protein
MLQSRWRLNLGERMVSDIFQMRWQRKTAVLTPAMVATVMATVTARRLR